MIGGVDHEIGIASDGKRDSNLASTSLLLSNKPLIVYAGAWNEKKLAVQLTPGRSI